MEKVLLDLKYRLAFELMPPGYANRVWENRRLAAEKAGVMLGRDRRLRCVVQILYAVSQKTSRATMQARG
jgi:hypothetical protein